MAFGATFKRYEKKFLLNIAQYETIKKEIDKYFSPDKYGETTICNIYYDTPDFLLIRRSNDKPIFKEKIRLRTYGVPDDNTISFLEVKRKFDKVVYKRRINMPYSKMLDYLSNGKKNEYTWAKPVESTFTLKVSKRKGKNTVFSADYTLPKDHSNILIKVNSDEKSQITKELEYTFKLYMGIEPKFYISYDRSAFFYNETNDIRVTFDKNLIWRDYDLDLRLGSYGEQLLPDDHVIMEVKVPNTVPLWLSQLLSELKVYATSFSKVGTAYKTKLSREINASAISTGNMRLIMQEKCNLEDFE